MAKKVRNKRPEPVKPAESKAKSAQPLEEEKKASEKKEVKETVVKEEEKTEAVTKTETSEKKAEEEKAASVKNENKETAVKEEEKAEVKKEETMENKANESTKPAECVITRKTKETSITLGLRLYGAGNYDVNTGVGFFDHMLEGFARHGNFDLKVIGKGDLNVDCHHTVEDVGIVLGQAIKGAVGDKEGMNRYASFIQPMDDALVLVSVDLCNRTYLNFDYDFKVERVGYFETETLKEFFRAVADEAGMNIHIKVLDGTNTHHIIEATFKAFANALAIAVSKNGRVGILSTKGTLS